MTTTSSSLPRIDGDAYARLRKLTNDRKDVMVAIRFNRLRDRTGRETDSRLTDDLVKELQRIDVEFRDEEVRLKEASSSSSCRYCGCIPTALRLRRPRRTGLEIISGPY